MRPRLQMLVLCMSLPLRRHGDELAVAVEVPNRTWFVAGMLISHAQNKIYQSTEDSAAHPWYVDDQAPFVSVRHYVCSMYVCACAPGSFSGAAATACTPCALNTYQDAAGADACLACPQNSVSPSGSDALADCECVAGFGYDGGGDPQNPCVACTHGEYKTTTSNAACEACDPGDYTENMGATTADSCLLCGHDSVGSLFRCFVTSRPCSVVSWLPFQSAFRDGRSRGNYGDTV